MLKITSKGIEVDDYETTYNRLVESFKRIYGQDINLDSDTPDGQLLELFANELFIVYDVVSFLVKQLDPYLATGQYLEQRALYAGILRNRASYSYIDELIITGIPKTIIPYNTVITDSLKNNWIISEKVTLNELGSARVKIRSVDLGDYEVKKGDSFTLKTVVIGVEKIEANTASYGGSDEETDQSLLIRFMQSHEINNLNDRDGIQAALLSVAGVEQAIVYENFTHQTDEKGIPAHSLNAVIIGGDDKAIARTLARKSIGGCGMFGKIEASTIIAEAERKVWFDRASFIDVHVKLTIDRYKTFQDIDIDSIEEDLKALSFQIGENVYASRLISQINLTEGFYIKQLTANDQPVIEITPRQCARITSVEVIIA